MRGRRALGVGVTAIVACLAGPAAAPADHHRMKIREFMPGTAAVANDSFLELQMYSPGQQFVNGHDIYVYPPGSGGAAVFTFNPTTPILTNGGSQRTVLARGSSGPPGDFTENLDGAGSPLSPSGGAICFVSTAGFGTIDCVEWGTGNTNVDTGQPVLPGGIPDGNSIERSISRGCPTLLESADDTDDSAADFAASTSPTPRANATAPTEHACANTSITKHPRKRTTKRRATFEFKSSVNPATFECKLDSGPFADCVSAFTKRVSRGAHKFKARATAEEFTDPSPASYSWKVVRPRR